MISINEKLTKIEKNVLKEYLRKTPSSSKLYGRAVNVFPAGVTYHLRWFHPYPFYVSRAEGPYVWDVDGNMYVDFWMGHGSQLLGHRSKIVLEGVSKYLEELGSHVGFEHPLAVEYAEFLSENIPCVEELRFTNSGTEAAMYAIRLARAYTGKLKIVKVNGGWHGGYDTLHIGVSPPYSEPGSAGLPYDTVKYTITVPFNDLEALEKALRGRDVAAFIVEPVLGAGGMIEAKRDYLKGARELTEQYDSLLIFDEVITMFRLALGGAQEVYNVAPDIAILGKAVGGGFPGSGAFGGVREVMEKLNHIKYPEPKMRSAHGGTFTGNPVTLAAGYAMASYLKENRWIYEKTNKLWNNVRREIQKICDSSGIKCYATGLGSMLGIHFTNTRPWRNEEAVLGRWSDRIYEVMHLYFRVNGVIYLPENEALLLPSLIHGDSEARKLIETFSKFISELAKA